MTFIEAIHAHSNEDELPLLFSPEAKHKEHLSPPPVSEWVKDCLSKGKVQQAFFLIARVMELHFSEGVRLVQRHFEQFPDSQYKTKLNLLTEILESSSVVNTHEPIFKALQAYETKPSFGEAGLTISTVNFFARVNKLLTMREDLRLNALEHFGALSSDGTDDSTFEKQIQQIETYYAQFALANLDFAEPPAEVSRPAWQKATLDVAQTFIDHKGASTFSTEFRVSEMRKEIEKVFGENWFSEIERHKEEDNGERTLNELAHTYFIHEHLPEGATDIEVVTMSARGMVFKYKLGGKTYHWLDDMRFRLDQLNDGVVATKKHFLLEGIRDGQVVLIADGVEYKNFSCNDPYVFDDDLVAQLDHDSGYSSLWVNGAVVVQEDFDFIQSCQKVGKNLVIVYSNGYHQTCIIVSPGSGDILNTLEGIDVDFEIVDVFGKAFCVAAHENGMRKVFDFQHKTQILPSETMFVQEEPTERYVVFEIGEDEAIAYPETKRPADPSAVVLKKIDDGWVSSNFVLYESREEQGKTILEKSKLAFTEGVHQINPEDIVKKVHSSFEGEVNGADLLNYADQDVYLIRDVQNIWGYTLFKFNIDGSFAKHGFITTEDYQHCKLCVSEEGDAYSLDLSNSDSSDTSEYVDTVTYFKNGEEIASGGRGYVDFVGIYKTEPVVVVLPNHHFTKPSEIEFYWGDTKIDLLEEGDELIFGSINSSKTSLRSAPEFVGVYNQASGRVRELHPYTALDLKPQLNRELSRVELLTLDLAKLTVRLLELAEHEDVEKSSWEKKDLLGQMEYLVGLLLGKKKLYAIKDHEKQFVKDFFAADPALALEAIPLHLDPVSPESADALVKTFLPEVWDAEQAWKRAKARESHSFGSSENAESISTAQSSTSGDLALSEGEATLFSSDAKEQFTQGTVIGRVHNATPDGVIRFHLAQTNTKWQAVSLPSSSTLSSRSSSEYSLNVSQTQKVRLLLQPESVIDPESVTLVFADGHREKGTVSYEKGYPIVFVSSDVQTIEYKDKKINLNLKDVSWNSYQQFVGILTQKNKNLVQGLTKKLPLDARLKLALSELKKGNPIDSLADTEQLCRVSGVYDMDNAETFEQRNGLGVSESLEFARVRCNALSLEMATQSQSPFNESTLYAGACPESAVLLAGMLRELGFLAGVTSEFRPKANGEYSTTDAHASAFVLWPANTESGFEVVHLDGTFVSSTTAAAPPQPHVSLSQKLEQGVITIELEEEEEADGLTLKGVMPRKGQRDEKKAESLPSKGVAFELASEWESEKLRELDEYTVLKLIRLYDVLLGLKYAPVSSVTEAKNFRLLQNQNERWQALRESYRRQVHEGLVVARLRSGDGAQNKDQLIKAILLELRK